MNDCNLGKMTECKVSGTNQNQNDVTDNKQTCCTLEGQSWLDFLKYINHSIHCEKSLIFQKFNLRRGN